MSIRDSNLEGSERIYRFLLLVYPPGFAFALVRKWSRSFGISTMYGTRDSLQA
jgi:hypothetical protein